MRAISLMERATAASCRLCCPSWNCDTVIPLLLLLLLLLWYLFSFLRLFLSLLVVRLRLLLLLVVVEPLILEAVFVVGVVVEFFSSLFFVGQASAAVKLELAYSSSTIVIVSGRGGIFLDA